MSVCVRIQTGVVKFDLIIQEGSSTTLLPQTQADETPSRQGTRTGHTAEQLLNENDQVSNAARSQGIS